MLLERAVGFGYYTVLVVDSLQAEQLRILDNGHRAWKVVIGRGGLHFDCRASFLLKLLYARLHLRFAGCLTSHEVDRGVFEVECQPLVGV